jgi:hypothetical protein
LSKSQVKVLIIAFFNVRGLIMIKWVLEGQMVLKKLLLGGRYQAPRTNEKERARIVEEEIMGSASRQCASSQRPHHELNFGR